MAIFPEQGREATGKRFAFDFASGLGKMVNELVQMCAIGNDVCALSNTQSEHLRAMQLTIYVRDADTWKIRMAYFKFGN